jgi:hypothetical protein
LNLIIAILANTYNIFDTRSNGLFLSKILASRDELIYDENYGSFLCAMPPLNAIQIPFVPAALWIRKGVPILEKINSFVMQIQYVTFMLLFFSLFIGVSLALTPFAWIIGIF